MFGRITVIFGKIAVIFGLLTVVLDYFPIYLPILAGQLVSETGAIVGTAVLPDIHHQTPVDKIVLVGRPVDNPFPFHEVVAFLAALITPGGINHYGLILRNGKDCYRVDLYKEGLRGRRGVDDECLFENGVLSKERHQMTLSNTSMHLLIKHINQHKVWLRLSQQVECVIPSSRTQLPTFCYWHLAYLWLLFAGDGKRHCVTHRRRRKECGVFQSLSLLS